MSDVVSTVRLVNGRWVGACPDCKRDDVRMKLWEAELRVHKDSAGTRCSGSGKRAVNYDEVTRANYREMDFLPTPGVTRLRPRPPSNFDWTEDGPGQWCAIWKGWRIYIVRDGTEWVVRRPGWPKSDIRIDGRYDLAKVQHVVTQEFAR